MLIRGGQAGYVGTEELPNPILSSVKPILTSCASIVEVTGVNMCVYELLIDDAKHIPILKFNHNIFNLCEIRHSAQRTF